MRIDHFSGTLALIKENIERALTPLQRKIIAITAAIFALFALFYVTRRCSSKADSQDEDLNEVKVNTVDPSSPEVQKLAGSPSVRELTRSPVKEKKADDQPLKEKTEKSPLKEEKAKTEATKKEVALQKPKHESTALQQALHKVLERFQEQEKKKNKAWEEAREKNPEYSPREEHEDQEVIVKEYSRELIQLLPTLEDSVLLTEDEMDPLGFILAIHGPDFLAQNLTPGLLACLVRNAVLISSERFLGGLSDVPFNQAQLQAIVAAVSPDDFEATKKENQNLAALAKLIHALAKPLKNMSLTRMYKSS